MLSCIALFIGAALAVPAVPRASCPDYALVAARGTGEPQGPSLGFSGLFVNGMTNMTLSRLPNGVLYNVIYPADATPWSETAGSSDAVRYINESRTACPNQKFALLGYSQGATVALMTLEAFDTEGEDDFIKAVVMLGNPYHKKGQVSTIDENNGTSTQAYDGVLLFIDPSIGLSDEEATSGRVLDICDSGDPVCTGVRLESIGPGHFVYPISEKVQTLAMDFLVKKLE